MHDFGSLTCSMPAPVAFSVSAAASFLAPSHGFLLSHATCSVLRVEQNAISYRPACFKRGSFSALHPVKQFYPRTLRSMSSAPLLTENAISRREDMIPLLSSSEGALPQERDLRMSTLFESLMTSLTKGGIEDLFVFVAGTRYWTTIEPVFIRYLFDKMQSADDSFRRELHILARGLKTAKEEIETYEQLLAEFRSLRSDQWEGFVAKHVDDLGERFSVFMKCKVDSCIDKDSQQRLDLEVASTVIAEMRDTIMVNRTMGEEIGGMEEVDKDTDLSKTLQMTESKPEVEELKGMRQPDDRYGEGIQRIRTLYRAKRGAPGLKLPPQIQMVQYLLSVLKKPVDLHIALRDFFLPPEMQGMRADPALEGLSTTPEQLLDTIDMLLTSYESKREEPLLGILETERITDSLMNLRMQVLKRCDFLRDIAGGDVPDGGRDTTPTLDEDVVADRMPSRLSMDEDLRLHNNVRSSQDFFFKEPL
mmetsp:Transcript_42057/g.68242  ORF Transcript_42057/g.68242 Transcript_42057/m.68242 type:complete len:477 (+) Transcript_42057:185-1615(+)